MVNLTKPRYIHKMNMPKFLPVDHPNLPRRLAVVILEILAGLLLLLGIGAFATIWWFEQSNNRDLLRDAVTTALQSHLGDETTFDFEVVHISPQFDPPSLRIAFDNVMLTRPTQRLTLQRGTLWFSLQELLLLRIIPQRVVLDTPILTTTEAKQSDTHITSIRQIGAMTLLWLMPEYTPDSRWAAPGRELTTVEINNFHAQLVDGTIRVDGNLLMQRSNSNSNSILLDGSITSTHHLPEPLSGRFRLSRNDDKLNFSLSTDLPVALLAAQASLAPYRDWFAELGATGLLHSESQIDIDDFFPALERAESSTNIAEILAPLSTAAHLRWPQKDPVLEIQLQKPPHQSLNISVKNRRPFTPPALHGRTLPEITALEARFDVKGNIFQDLNATIYFGTDSSLTLFGDYELATTTGNLAFHLNNVAYDDLPADLLPAKLTLKAGKLVEASGNLKLTPGHFTPHNLRAEARDLILAQNNALWKIPNLKLVWDTPDNLQLSAPGDIDYQGIRISDARLSGNPGQTFHTQASVRLTPEITRQHAKLLPPLDLLMHSGLLQWQEALQFAITADFQPKSGTLTLKSIKNQTPLRGNLLGEPLHIARLAANTPGDLKIDGLLADSPLTLDLQFDGTTQTIDFAIPKLPTRLLKPLLHTFAAKSGAEAEFSGHFALEGSARLGNGLESLSIKTDFTSSAIHLTTPPLNKPNGHVVKLTLDAQHDTKHKDDWRLVLSSQSPDLSGQLELLFNSKQQKIVRILSRDLQIQDTTLTINAKRQDGGLDLRLESNVWHSGQGLIDFLKAENSGIPAALMPLKHFSWQFHDRIQFASLDFGSGSFAIDFQTHDANGQEIQNPGLDSLKRLSFRFLEPTLSSTDNQNTTSVKAHELDFIPGKTLQLSSPNAGKLLKIFSITDSVSGGVLHTNLHSIEQMQGSLSLDNFTLQNTSGAVKFLQAISLTGLIPLLVGEGLPFTILNADVSGSAQQWHFDNLKAYGPSLSMTFSGSLDIENETVSGKGTTSPTSILNALISNIPLIGTLLTGTDSGGLVAANYTVSGSIRDPEVKTKPLSLLQPGILRNIFGDIDKALGGKKAKEQDK